MRFLCFGAGAIGTYIGGSLVLVGNSVVFVDRPQAVQSIQKAGLQLCLDGIERTIPNPDVVGSIEEALGGGPFDLALVAIKSFDTAVLVDDLRLFSSGLPPFLCLQNGVENEALIAELLGKENVIAGSVTTPVGRRATGSIVVEKRHGVGISGQHSIIPALIEGMNIAGLNARRYPDPDSMKWSKMLTNLWANATSAILDMSPADIFAHPGLFRLELCMVKEALSVMDVLKIPVTDLPGIPVRLLVWIVRSLPPRISQILLMNSLGKGRGGKMPSFHIDLYSGRKNSEVDYLNGAVVRFGEKFGVPTPVNRWLNETLVKIAAGSMDKNMFAHEPDKFLKAAEDIYLK